MEYLQFGAAATLLTAYFMKNAHDNKERDIIAMLNTCVFGYAMLNTCVLGYTCLELLTA